jgi:predicted phosphoadenosine phosphosulfate sulfurtransferase
MKIFLKKNVLEAAKERVRWLFEEFPNVIAGVSGGKDSTVVFHLCLEVAREMGRLPLKTMFLDQEAEWQATVDQIRFMMEHPDVEPMWFQMPIKLFNATSTQENWLYCWDENKPEGWMRPKEKYAYTENRYGTDRFAESFGNIIAKEFPDTPTCYVSGVRTEENFTRFMALTRIATYKDVTWGKRLNVKRGHYTFYPIYDWTYMDVWKAIGDHKWPYNKIYDAQYNYGVPLKDMRVSNVHHETAVHSLFYMQEVEPETWVKLTQRIEGIDMAGKMGTDDFFVRELPFMFGSWPEYRDYLVDKLIEKSEWRDGFRKRFAKFDAMFGDTDLALKMHKLMVNSVLTNDWEGIKLHNWETQPAVSEVRKRKQGVKTWRD